MSRPKNVALQRCFLFGSVPRGVEDAAPYSCKCSFFDKLRPRRNLRGRFVSQVWSVKRYSSWQSQGSAAVWAGSYSSASTQPIFL